MPLPLIPIALGAGAVALIAAASAASAGKSPATGKIDTPKTDPADGQGTATPSTPGTGATSGATSKDDAFDVLVANAVAKKDTAALEALAAQAEARGLYDVAKSIRAEIAAIKGEAPPLTTTTNATNAPREAPVSTSTGRAVLSVGSKGPDVVEWQKIVGVTADGIFGAKTQTATKTWQGAHGLVADGIVGPKTWAAAYAQKPALATTPRTATVAVPTTTKAPTTTTASTHTTLKLGSLGTAVKEWQGILNRFLNATGSNYTPLTIDGNFGQDTEKTTLAFQRAHGLLVDGIVGPKTWAAAGAPVPQAAPALPAAPSATPDSDQRQAAIELTTYLQSIGGLAGRYKENKTMVKGFQTRLGVPADGSYGRGSAKACMMLGIIPVAPYYWPSTGTAAAKAEFLALVDQYAGADPARATQWAKLRADTVRS